MNTTDKQANKKTAIRFMVILLVLYVLFSQGNLFMNSVFSQGGRFYNPFLADNFNYIQGLRWLLITPARAIINAFGYYAISNGMDVLIVNGPILRVYYSCLGLGVMSFLAAFVIAFPSPVKAKIKMILIGFIVVYVLNVFRIAGLGLLVASFKSQRALFTYHHEIFNIIVYIVIVIMLFFWIKRMNAAQASEVKK